MKVAFHTLGCKVNQYETEAIRQQFIRAGHEIVGEDDFADVYIINTCTVTNLADRKSRQFIRKSKKVNPNGVIGVTGCYAQMRPDEVAEIDGVEIVVGTDEKNNLLKKVEEYFDTHNRAFIVKEYGELTEYEDLGVIEAMESRSRAFVKIEEGCNRFCSFCIIPYARGKVRSRARADIVKEVNLLVERGHKEVVLTGINTALYGEEKGNLEIVDLLKELDKISGDFRIRLSSLEPTVIDADYVKKLFECKRLCHHLHLSIQSGSNKVLKEMNRRYSRNDYLEIIKVLRAFNPLYGITTDIIVGFPGETDEDFMDSLDIVQKVEFSKVHAFKYSKRTGTVAASRNDQVSGMVKNDRVHALMNMSESSREKFNARSIGTAAKALIEQQEDEFLTGYTDNYTKVYIRDFQKDIRLNEFYDVKLIGNYKDGMIAEIRV